MEEAGTSAGTTSAILSPALKMFCGTIFRRRSRVKHCVRGENELAPMSFVM
jgi:hypothetical protein